jgi:hemerythrin-like metal-binding protein
MSDEQQKFQASGFEPMDRQHLKLWDNLERLLAAVNAGQARDAAIVLGAVYEQFVAHFDMEQRLMTETRYPLAARHKEVHDLFLLDLNSNYATLRTEGITPRFRRWATGRALEWFRFHIAANDVGLGIFLLDRGPVAPPPAARD